MAANSRNDFHFANLSNDQWIQKRLIPCAFVTEMCCIGPSG